MNDVGAAAGVTCCILYTTDPTYLFPTLVSAMQARRHSSRHTADVLIFCLDLDEVTSAAFAPVCAAEGVRLVPLSRELIEGQSAMLARLFLTRFVPSHYKDYLYLDGDIHILGSLDPLLQMPVPDGHFLAVNDPMTFQLADNTALSNDLRMHLKTLGLSMADSLNYFNSGVLRICAAGWQDIGSEAWGHYQRLGTGSRFPDQDALNLAGRERKLPLSLTWNYPAFLRHSRVEPEIRPRIKHFMSSPKPWNGPFPPWSKADCEPYHKAIRRYPTLSPFRPNPLSYRDRLGYHLQQNGKRLVESVSWGLSKRRDRILNYQASCSLQAAARAETVSLRMPEPHVALAHPSH